MSMSDRDGFIWQDGKMVPWREATTHVLTHSLHYGMGVFEGGHSPGDPLYQAAIWMIVFYVADRVVLSIAKRRIGFALHAASRLDGFVRSFIARRNITMTIMAFGVLLGVGPAAFYVITAWQGLTFAWHAARTVWHGFLSRAQARPAA